MEIKPIDLRAVDERAANIYEAIIVASKKARQLNTENKIEFNALVGSIPATGTDDDADDIENPAQIKISMDFEKRAKPQIQAVHDLLDGKIEFSYKQ
jgi:DNA-directed RNA polymerase subunit K/omega